MGVGQGARARAPRFVAWPRCVHAVLQPPYRHALYVWVPPRHVLCAARKACFTRTAYSAASPARAGAGGARGARRHERAAPTRTRAARQAVYASPRRRRRAGARPPPGYFRPFPRTLAPSAVAPTTGTAPAPARRRKKALSARADRTIAIRAVGSFENRAFCYVYFSRYISRTRLKTTELCTRDSTVSAVSATRHFVPRSPRGVGRNRYTWQTRALHSKILGIAQIARNRASTATSNRAMRTHSHLRLMTAPPR